MDLLRGKKIMVWTFMGNARMYEALQKYGDRIDTVGLFSFKVNATGEIYESGVAISDMLPYIRKWPHITWLLTISNDGVNSVFRALRDNTDGAQDRFFSELIRIMQKYPWCSGVDIDLEKGDGYSTHAASTMLFKGVYKAVKGHDSSKRVNICLPGMTGVNGSVGGENWCVYAELDPYCDTAAIMSYGMAWAGSAPGPVSPRSWLEGIYDYAVQVMNPDKVFLGMPAYGWNWEIYDKPENIGRDYRGISNTYYAAKQWMTGGYNFTGDAPPQPFIPIVAYWDDYNKVPWALPHVYDYMEGQDAASYTPPQMKASYNGRKYLTAYSKQQKVDFADVIVERNGVPDEATGLVSASDNMCVLGRSGVATFNFSINTEGAYCVAVCLCYPFWDQNSICVSVDGKECVISENRFWWPYWRKTFWKTAVENVHLSAGVHTLTISTTTSGVQFYGFKVCGGFSEKPFAGSAQFTISPRQFKDINGNMAEPDRGFKLTCEMLRRKPDSALIWYEDFRDETPIPNTYWITLSGEWQVWRDSSSTEVRPYSQLEGHGKFAWRYDNFSDIHLRAQIILPENFTGKAGVFLGDLFCCINYDTQQLELYEGAELKGQYSAAYERTPEKDLRTNPSVYTIEMRKRGNRVRVYSAASSVLRFTATVSDNITGYCGIRADTDICCPLLRLGDAWTYEPYERFDVTLPDGSVESFGRISREGVTWDDEFQVFTLASDVEESDTRVEGISQEYDFFHSDLLTGVTCGGDYAVVIEPKDINIWISRLFLGDADGFSILYYQDVDSLVYWSNEAAYRWKLRGMCLWSLGQEDMRLWEYLPKQI